jgi:hypothetical protein
MTQEGGPNRTSGSEIATLNEDSEGDVTLTLRREKFAEFLFGFLGAKETLSKTFNEVFTVKIEDLLQFHYLLIQKIAKEQFISLSLETATIQYDDDTSRTINTIESIEKYNEYRDVGVLSFNLAWDFVFKAPNQTNIQQQKVSIFFETAGALSGTGTVTVRIEHTNQVWAAEVLHLFEEQLSKIVFRYTVAYRMFSFLKRSRILNIIAVACVLVILGGGIYIFAERSKLLHPFKVKEEFMFDMAKVIDENEDDRDLNLLLQFFLIRDLRNEPPSIIRQLQETGRFDDKYKEIIDKLISGYYDSDKNSERIGPTFEAMFREINAMENITWAYSYLKFFLLYFIGYMLTLLYLRLFRMKSILAITTRGIKLMDKQEREKSTLLQFIFGVVASILAAIIFEFTIAFLLK